MDSPTGIAPVRRCRSRSCLAKVLEELDVPSRELVPAPLPSGEHVLKAIRAPSRGEPMFLRRKIRISENNLKN